MITTLLFSTLALAAGPTKAAMKPTEAFRFVEMKSYKQEPSLPPTLQVTFEVDCADEFVKVIREEITDAETKKVTIAIGGIVKSNLQSACVGTFRDKTVEAGTTFSGREFEIVKILKDSKKTKVMKSASAR